MNTEPLFRAGDMVRTPMGEVQRVIQCDLWGCTVDNGTHGGARYAPERLTRAPQPRMTKDKAWLLYYDKTRPLERKTATVGDFKAAFPTRESLMKFWQDVRKLSWPESYGQSPWDTTACVAYRVANGIRRNDAEDAFVAAFI